MGAILVSKAGKEKKSKESKERSGNLDETSPEAI